MGNPVTPESRAKYQFNVSPILRQPQVHAWPLSMFERPMTCCRSDSVTLQNRCEIYDHLNCRPSLVRQLCTYMQIAYCLKQAVGREPLILGPRNGGSGNFDNVDFKVTRRGLLGQLVLISLQQLQQWQMLLRHRKGLEGSNGAATCRHIGQA